MAKEDTKFDVAVIGAGPAGIMAACIAAKVGARGSPVGLRPRVILIEKNKQLARKLLLTGNGRCNITNAEFNLRELVKNYNNGEFLFHAFSVFGPEEVIKFFEELEIKTKIEVGKRVFPESDDANEVLEALNKCLVENKVNILFETEVADVIFKGKKISKLVLSGLEGNSEISAKEYIICTGGKSYSTTGSVGTGYKLAEKLGHTIIKPSPALSPIKMKEEWVKGLKGISLKDMRINVTKDGKKQFSEEGGLVFTDFGISGPSVLNISGRVGDLMEKSVVRICFDLFPLLNHEQLLGGIEDVLIKYPRQTAKNVLSSFVAERFAEILLGLAKIDKNKMANSMSKVERLTLVKILKNVEITPEEVLGFEQAIVTKGGVSLREIDHRTMKSKIIDNLSFAGEIIDVDGKTGGFNLQMCWSTGYTAGKSCRVRY